MIETHELEALTAALSRKPRVQFGHFPTPIDAAPRLSERLGVPIYLKRDDLTGMALGGNKVRKLEFLMGDALERGADTIVTTGGTQSNHARLTAAACRRTGLDCLLVLDRGVHPEPQGNLLLDRLFGAQVRLIESPDPAVAVEEMDRVAEELRDAGRKPYVIPRGGSIPQGATGYAAFVVELLEQLHALDLRPTHIYLGTGSAGTHSGVLAGLTAVGSGLTLQGISVSRAAPLQVAKVQDLANGVLGHLGLDLRVDPASVLVDDRFAGPGYGIPTEQTMEAIELLALDEGVVLDPVYTGKAMAGLIGHAREGVLGPDATVLFVHTGGAPALFAYNEEVAASLGAVG